MFWDIVSSGASSAAEDAPQAKQAGVPIFSREQHQSQGHCRASQGELHSLPGKTVGLLFEISCVAGQRREDGISTPRTQGRAAEQEERASQGHHNVQGHHREESCGDDIHPQEEGAAEKTCDELTTTLIPCTPVPLV